MVKFDEICAKLRKERKINQIFSLTSYNDVKDSSVRALLELKRMELERSNWVEPKKIKGEHQRSTQHIQG